MMRLLGPVVVLVMALALAACNGDSGGASIERPAAAASTDQQAVAVAATPAPQTTESAPEAMDAASLVDCVQTSSQTEGPYYFDTGELRRDITEGLPGTPLLVSLRIVEAGSCEPVAGATVDIWHTDVLGQYSGYPGQGAERADTTGETFLRGKQVTNADGIAEFETIYPGWYPTRAVHIHFMTYTDAAHLVTSQLYLPDTVSEMVYQTEHYAARGTHPVTNGDDGIFPGNAAGSSLIGQVTEKGEGYMVALTVGVTR